MNFSQRTKRWLALGVSTAALGGGGAALAVAGSGGSSPDPGELAPNRSSVTVPNAPDLNEPNEGQETPGTEGPEGAEAPESAASEKAKDTSEAAETAQLAKVAKVDEAQAKSAALSKVPGTVQKAELGDENGNVVWEVEVKGDDGKTHEVKVDAGNATVLSAQVDND